MPDKEHAQGELKKLLERYQKQKSEITNEQQLCDSLISPFFSRVLGWDTENPSEFKAQYSQRGKRMDYITFINGISQFIIEVKALNHDIKANYQDYQQALNYARNKEKDFAILTNFKQFVILRADIEKEPLQSEIRTVDVESVTDFGIIWNFHIEIWSSEKGEKLYALKPGKKRVPVTKQLVDDMKRWRLSLLKNLRSNTANKLDFETELNYIEQEVQRFLDRLIFICYCEDKELQERELKGILEAKETEYNGKTGFLLKEVQKLVSHYREKYDSDLFNDYGYCDKFVLDDSALVEIFRDLRKPFRKQPYDFAAIDTDVLGKAYENFIGHIITGTKRYKEKEAKSKRKEEGIYYTPQYIVNYIVDNTVRAYIRENNINSFDNLLRVKILDPACGSGTFLIRAFEVLEEEAGRIKNVKELEYSDRIKLMLNCIHGVDKDERAADIAKLNLSLKLAARQKLPELGNNIKTGDSLIDDESVAGAKAFRWEQEFKDVMNKGGFDVVIGNPPWLMAGYHVGNELKHLHTNYISAKGKFDLYYCFIEKSIFLLNTNGYFGMIVPNKFFHTKAATSLRDFLATSEYVTQIIDFGYEKIFGDATNYSGILFARKSKNQSLVYLKMDANLNQSLELAIETNRLNKSLWNFHKTDVEQILIKIKKAGEPLKEIVSRFGTGVQTGSDKIFILKRDKISEFKGEKNLLKAILKGKNVRKYHLNGVIDKVIFPYDVVQNTFKIMEEKIFKKYKRTYNYLSSNKTILNRRIWFGKNAKQLSGEWYGLMYLDSYKTFESQHILTPSLSNESNFCLDFGNLFVTGTAGVTSIIIKNIKENIKYLLGLLNSNLINLYIISNSPVFQGGYHKFSANYLKNIPIRRINFSLQEEKELHDEMVKLVDSISVKYQQSNEIRDQFNIKRMEEKIKGIEKQINSVVYRLYNVAEKEQQLIESSLK